MECCSSNSSLDYEGDLENVCAILAADTVTVRRKVWVHDINMKRKEKGEFHHFVKEHEEHPNRYEKYFRMTKEGFNFLRDLIRGDIKTRNAQFQEAISREEKLTARPFSLNSEDTFIIIIVNEVALFNTLRQQ
jgi:hypothetical protein